MVSPTPHQSNPHVGAVDLAAMDDRAARGPARRQRFERTARRSVSGEAIVSDSRDRRTVEIGAAGAAHTHRSPRSRKTFQIQA